MAKYLHFETKAGAANRSKELWGGDEDAVTQHLYTLQKVERQQEVVF